MKKEELIDRYKKIVDNTIPKLEKYDRFPRSQSSFENSLNWFLTISTASLLWLLNSFDKFTVSDKLVNKWLYLISILFCTLSTVFFSISRISVLFRKLGMDTAFDDIDRLPGKLHLNRERMTEEDMEKKFDSVINRSLKLWRFSHNLIPGIFPIIKLGLYFFIFGIVNLILYVSIFLVKFK